MKRRPRPAHKIQVPLYSPVFNFREPDQGVQIEEVWIPPSAGMVEGIEGLGLPMPDISTFHVAGFDIKVSRLPEEAKAIRVTVSMHVMSQGYDKWTAIESGDVLHLHNDKLALAAEWKLLIHRLIARLIGHELDESLRFDGVHYRGPHPEKRLYQKAMEAARSGMSEKMLDLLRKAEELAKT